MDLINLPFEESLAISTAAGTVRITVFKTLEQGNVKLGVDAPRSLAVHREEIYYAIKQKQKDLMNSTR
ncbi:MAG: carbon storage regulator [Legionella sp.]|nr:carbon storage regulator [Legionella sp.]